MRTILASALLAAGCMSPPVGAREPTASERQVIAATAGDECDAETLARTRIVTPDTREQMQSLTGYCEPPDVPGACFDDSQCRWGCAAGAYQHYRDGVWPFALASRWPLLVLWSGSYSSRLLAHEAEHLEAECRTGNSHTHH